MKLPRGPSPRPPPPPATVTGPPSQPASACGHVTATFHSRRRSEPGPRARWRCRTLPCTAVRCGCTCNLQNKYSKMNAIFGISSYICILDCEKRRKFCIVLLLCSRELTNVQLLANPKQLKLASWRLRLQQHILLVGTIEFVGHFFL